ncbi:MAG: hypothetical protein Q8Q67_00210 [bacterium]|nr:hypothetical protein [bacterium]
MKQNINTISRGQISSLIREAFNFFSTLLILGAIVEFIFPGLFSLFVNAAILVAGWLISLALLLIYVRR